MMLTEQASFTNHDFAQLLSHQRSAVVAYEIPDPDKAASRIAVEAFNQLNDAVSELRSEEGFDATSVQLIAAHAVVLLLSQQAAQEAELSRSRPVGVHCFPYGPSSLEIVSHSQNGLRKSIFVDPHGLVTIFMEQKSGQSKKWKISLATQQL